MKPKTETARWETSRDLHLHAGIAGRSTMLCVPESTPVHWDAVVQHPDGHQRLVVRFPEFDPLRHFHVERGDIRETP